MKTLYWNGVSDVQVYNENKKTRKNVGIALIKNVFSAIKEGNVRIVKMTNNQNVGISESEWNKFMNLHNTEENILKAELSKVKPI